MTTAQRHGYHHPDLRQALLDTGLELTRVGGPSALVLREVTRRVGVSPNAAYRHFTDREALTAAVAEQIRQRMVLRMREQGTSYTPSSARSRLRAVGLGYIGFAVDEPGWFETAFTDIDAAGETEPPGPLAMLLAALDGLVAAGELSPSDRIDAEWPCWSAVHGFAVLALHGPMRGHPPERIRAEAGRTVDAIIAGLLGSDADRSR